LTKLHTEPANKFARSSIRLNATPHPTTRRPPDDKITRI
jgi:hypothetical protein